MDQILVCDDASADGTHQVGLEYQARGDLPLTVVRHDRNLGYGGNQKSGYRWAISHGLDVVVLLHGDGQYAPEVIEDIVAPLVDGRADAVLGSRMLTRGAARTGGMPLYKFAGNRILTTMQNALVGLELVGVAQRIPRLPNRRPRRHPLRVVLRRVRLRHRDHPRPSRRGEDHPRGADPDVLRRRDLLRRTAFATPRTSPLTYCPLPAAENWASAELAGVARGSALRAEALHRTRRTACS